MALIQFYASEKDNYKFRQINMIKKAEIKEKIRDLFKKELSKVV